MKKLHNFFIITFLLLTVIFCIGCENAVKPEPSDDNKTKNEQEDTDVSNNYSYTVHFDDDNNSYYNDESSAHPDPEYIYVSSPETTVKGLPEPPVRSNYKFDGWYTERNGEGTEFTADTEVTDDITVYAKWIRYYNVHFVLFSEDLSLRVREGDLVTKPKTPVIDSEDYVFDGWYRYDRYTGLDDVPFDFSTPITDDTEIYAIWKTYYEICFCTNITTETFPDTYNYCKVLQDETIKEPEEPVCYGYLFEGWYTDSARTIPFDFSTPIKKNTYIYAKWTRLTTYYVHFYIGYDNLKDYQRKGDMIYEEIVEGDLVPKPEDPSIEGYIFEGWYTYDDEYNTIPFNFVTPITENMNIYAKLVPENSFEVSITVEPCSDISISREYDDQILRLIADPGYESYIWKINGVVQSEESNILLFDKSTRPVGNYVISVKAKKDGEYKSETIYVEVSK